MIIQKSAGTGIEPATSNVVVRPFTSEVLRPVRHGFKDDSKQYSKQYSKAVTIQEQYSNIVNID